MVDEHVDFFALGPPALTLSIYHQKPTICTHLPLGSLAPMRWHLNGLSRPLY